MKYLKFIVENFRAIQSPIIVNVEKDHLIPIIGVNESGKTTLLHAIFAFDADNDILNSGRHLEDTENLYSLNSPPARVSAAISVERGELASILSGVKPEVIPAGAISELLPFAERYEGSLTVTRHLDSRTYSTDLGFVDQPFDSIVGTLILKHLPWILFFDDFRDSVDDRIEIVKQAD